MEAAAGPRTPRQRPPGHMIEYYSELAAEPMLLDFYGAGFAATPLPASGSVSLPDTPYDLVVSEGVPPLAVAPHLSAAAAGLALVLMEPEPEPEQELEPEPEPEPGPELVERSRSRRVSFKNEEGEAASSVRSTSSSGSVGGQSSRSSSDSGIPKEPDEAVDLACSTLLTTVFLLLSTPTTSRSIATLVCVLAVTVFTAQSLFAWKLVNNASDP